MRSDPSRIYRHGRGWTRHRGAGFGGQIRHLEQGMPEVCLIEAEPEDALCDGVENLDGQEAGVAVVRQSEFFGQGSGVRSGWVPRQCGGADVVTAVMISPSTACANSWLPLPSSL